MIHLILAQVFLNWPLAFRQIYAVLSKIPGETIDAARILSHRKRDLIFRIYLPQSSRGILSALGFCFAVSAGDTTLPLVLALPKFSNLSLFTYRLASCYRFHEACAAGLILGFLCAAVFAGTNRLKN
jgi:thiamine transport system permease protein